MMTITEAIKTWETVNKRIVSPSTFRRYMVVYRQFETAFAGVEVRDIDRAMFADWFNDLYGEAKPSTWNVSRSALHNLYALLSDLEEADPKALALVKRQRIPADKPEAMTRPQVEKLLADEMVTARERALYAMLYESAARVSELLALNVPDLDLVGRHSRVTRKGGARDTITWLDGASYALAVYLDGRTEGPLFVTDRLGKSNRVNPDDTDPEGHARVSYGWESSMFREVADRLFPDAHFTIHSLRVAALTHAAEDEVSLPLLMAMSGHKSVKSLAGYTRVSPARYVQFRQGRGK